MLSPVVFVKVMLNLSLFSGAPSIFNRVKDAKVNVLLSVFDVGAPFLRSFVPAHTDVSTAVMRWPFLVFGIFGSRNRTQVANPVVQSVAVNMINFIGPKSQVHCDDDTMGRNGFIKQPPASVSVAPNSMQRQLIGVSRIPSRAVCLGAISAIAEKFWRSLSPIKKAGFGVIFKKSVERFGGRNLICHSASYHGATPAAMEDGNAYI